jgi:hypothetical protein
MAQQSPQDERKQRLAAALRENLKRRKAQAKAHARQHMEGEASDEAGPEQQTHSHDGVRNKPGGAI